MKKDKYLNKLVLKLLEVSFKDGRMVESQVVKSIKALKSLSLSDSILALTEYVKQLKRLERAHTMYIETTIPLTFQQINKLKKIVEKKILVTKVLVNINEDILGGFKLRIGDQIWDESILGRIDKVKEVIQG